VLVLVWPLRLLLLRGVAALLAFKHWREAELFVLCRWCVRRLVVEGDALAQTLHPGFFLCRKTRTLRLLLLLVLLQIVLREVEAGV
jgi:hypothetical protein